MWRRTGAWGAAQLPDDRPNIHRQLSRRLPLGIGEEYLPSLLRHTVAQTLDFGWSWPNMAEHRKKASDRVPPGQRPCFRW